MCMTKHHGIYISFSCGPEDGSFQKYIVSKFPVLRLNLRLEEVQKNLLSNKKGIIIKLFHKTRNDFKEHKAFCIYK